MDSNIFVDTGKGTVNVYRDGVLLNRRSAIDTLFNIYRKADKSSENAKILSKLIRELQAA